MQLTTVLRIGSFFSHGQVRKNVSWLFPEDGDVDRAAAFFRNLLWTKETMCQTTKSEASAFSKLLMKRTKQNDLCKVPPCTGRAWLVQIWKDVPSTRPHHEMLVSCVVRWLADPYETQGRRFKQIPYMQRKVKAKDLVPHTIIQDFQIYNFWLSLHLSLFHFLVESPYITIISCYLFVFLAPLKP